MKIIHVGQKRGEGKARATCRECFTEFEVLKMECDFMSSPRPDDSYYEVECPHCDARVAISMMGFR